ncbi:MAG TPA: tetratricopeptide repeat protein [Kofleriaceae bacterium]|jgi:outer membrane protein assembly factor BamD (BamD/ComL family)
MRCWRISATLALLLSATPALADESISNKLSGYESEAKALGMNLPMPSSLVAPQKTLTEAEVAFELGDYETAASALFDLASRPGPDREAATYYLGETLYQKGDRGAAHGYFTAIAQIPASKYYQPSLVRLVEISIAQQDMPAANDALAKLAAVGSASAQLPYVRGKVAFATQQYDEAINAFANVPHGSDFELQALYYTGASQVAKKDIAKATDTFTDLIGRKPRTNADRRVVELGQLALGRLYYEADEPSKSIDAYLMIDRHSDLFPDALYEVAWVYVKGKQFDKALRALELLEESDPGTSRTPTTRILEGNLRIRKAQAIRLAQITGTSLTNDTQDPGIEYDKAVKIFNDTHDQYYPSYQAISQVVDGNMDASAFVDQLAGRTTHTVTSAPPIPDAAAQWLRDEPAVQRIVDAEQDLGEIANNIRRSEQTIARLQAVIATNDRTNVYPAIASRRHRIAAIEASLVGIRNDLADQQLRLVDSSGDLAQLSAARKQLAQQYAQLGDPEALYSSRVRDTRAGYDAIETTATEIESALDSTQAMAIAMRKYALDSKPATDPTSDLDAAAKDAQAIEDELADIRQQATLGKDLAGIGDPEIASARDLRRQLMHAQDAEQRSLDGFAAASHDRNASQKLAKLADRATELVTMLDATDAQLDGIVAQGIEAAKADLSEQQTILGDSKQQLAQYEQEAHALGSAVLAQSFKDVKAKLYDVIVRTDVGVVDVSWSQKQDDDDDLKRLNLARSRELRQLHDEFKDVLEETTPAKQAPRKSDLPPVTEEGASPDSQTAPTNDRVAPSSGGSSGTQQPSVKPDQNAPKKKGGSK